MRIRRRRRERCSRWQMLGRCISVGSALARKSKFCIIIIVEQETSWFVCSIQVTLFLLYYALHLVNCLQIFGIFFIYLFDDHWGWCGVLESTCTDILVYIVEQFITQDVRGERKGTTEPNEGRLRNDLSYELRTNETQEWTACRFCEWTTEQTNKWADVNKYYYSVTSGYRTYYVDITMVYE